MLDVSYEPVYKTFHEIILKQQQAQEDSERFNTLSKFAKYMKKKRGPDNTVAIKKDGFARMQACRDALNAIDTKGWNRSFHQRLFHDQFIRACARVFFKMDPPGTFARAHQSILEINSWENLSQEVLISTPRRFGKTISVSMFAAALIYSTPGVEISIYSTCKRISQKLLRNVQKFLFIIYDAMKTSPMKEIRSNMEEVTLQGPEGMGDVRVVNSYPSKVTITQRHEEKQERHCCLIESA